MNSNVSRTSPAARANAARGVAVLAAPALLAALLSLPTAASAASNGRLFLSTGGNTPASSLFTGPSYTFGAAAPTLPGGSSETFYVLKGATGEYLAGYVTSGGQLYVLRYNGSTGTWSNEFNVAVGGDGLNGRRFDIAYEKSTGRAVVVYSASSAVPGQQLRYRTWDPLAQGWSGELTFGSGQLTGTANWVKLASRPGTNEIAVAVADNANRLTALIWNGSSWGSEPPAAFTSSVSYTAVAGDLDAYDLAYSSQTGDLLVAWADKSLGTNGTTSVCHSQYVRASKTWLGSVSVWANTTSIPNYANAGATPYQVIASADPLSDNVAVLWSRKKITGAELDARFWRPSGWDAAGVVTITTTLAVPAPNTRQFAGLWLASSGYSGLIVPYQDSGGSAYYGACLTNGGVFSITTAAVPVSTGAAPKPWIQATSDRVATERGLVLFADSTSSLWVKQVTLSYSFPSVAVGWQSADGGAALSAALSTTAAPAFGFDYDQPALTSVGDNSGVEAVTGKSAYGSPATGSAPLYDVDHFTLATAAGTDRVTYMVINVTSGYAGVSAIYVTDDAGTVLGSLSNPQAGIGTYGSNNVSVSYSSGGIPVTTSPKQYRLLVKPGFDWSLLPGSSYTVTAKVASVTATNLSVNADVSNGSVVVSHTPPANGRLFTSTGGASGTIPVSTPYAAAANTFAAAANASAGGASETFYVLKSAPPASRAEYLAGYVTSGGQLYVQRYDGSAWSTEFNVPVGGDGVNGRRFDIAYEQTTGRGMVAYSASSSTAGQQLYYRIWDPAAQSWSGPLSFGSALLSGAANWVKLAARPGTNEIAVAVADSTNHLTALIWNGSGWGSEPFSLIDANLRYVTTPGDLDACDVAYSSQTGDLFVFASDGGSQLVSIRYKRSVASWQAATNDSYAGIYQLTAASDPVTDKVALVFGTTTGLYAKEWSGSAFNAIVPFISSVFDGSSYGPNRRQFAAAYVTIPVARVYGGPASLLVIPYQEASRTAGQISYAYVASSFNCFGAGIPGTNPNCGPYYVTLYANSGSYLISGTATAPVAWPNPGSGAKAWFQAVTDPKSFDRAMVVFADSGGALWAKRIMVKPAWVSAGLQGAPLDWTDADGGAAESTSLATTLAPAFAFDFQKPFTILGDNSGIEATAGTNACAPSGSSTALYDLDHFTLATSAGSDVVTAVTVNVTAGSSAIGSLYVTGDDGTVYGSLASPVAGNNIINLGSSGTTIPVTSTPAQYRIQVKPALLSLLLPGPSYPITASVATVTATNPIVGVDPSSGSVVVDRAPPASPTWGSISTQGNLQVNLSWTNPAASTVILRGASWHDVATTSLTDGNTYSAGGSSGADTVAYAGTGTSGTDQTTLGRYYYRAFAVDSCGNYSAGTTSPVVFGSPTVTIIGDNAGTEAASGTGVCAATASSTDLYDLDHFTLVTTDGADPVTQVTVNVTAGSNAIGTLYVTSDSGTVLGSLANPVPGNNVIPLSTSILATITPAQYRIQVKPALVTALASGANYTIAAKVATVTGTNAIAGADANGGSVVVLRAPPASPTWGPVTTFNVTGGIQVNLSWTNPGPPWASTIILRGGNGGNIATASLADGHVYSSGDASPYDQDPPGTDTVVYNGTGSSGSDRTSPGSYYRAFAADSCNNYSAGATTLTPTVPPVPANGRIFFSSGGSTGATPQSSFYSGSSNAFDTPAATLSGASSESFFVTKASPTRNGEYLAGYVTTGGQLYVLRYNGRAWSNEFNAAVGGDGKNGRRFDIAYERTSGRGVVVYSSNLSTSRQQLYYRIWDPAVQSWGSQVAFGSALLTGKANSVKLASRPGSNEVGLAVADNNSGSPMKSLLTALIWNGSAWGNEPSSLINSNVSYTSTVGDLDSYDLAYSSLAGDLFVCVSDRTDVYLYTSRYQRSTASWLARTASGYQASQVAVAADPVNDNVAMVFATSVSLEVAEWIGSGWFYGGSYNLAPYTLTNGTYRRLFAPVYLEAGGYTYLIVPYQESAGTINKISYAYLVHNFWCSEYLCGYGYTDKSGSKNAAITWASGSTSKTWMQAVTDPQSPDRAMLVFGDSSGYLYAKRMVANPGWYPTYNEPLLTFTNPDGSSGLGGSLATTSSPAFAFDYDQIPPQTLVADNSGTEASTGTSACAATASSTTLYDVDHFTLATTDGTDTVTKVTVNVTAGNNAIGTLYVTNDAGAVLGSLPNPVPGNNVITLSPSNIAVNTTPVQYRIQVKPALYSALAAGADYTISAKVMTVTASNVVIGMDATSGSVAVDRTPPANPTWATPPFNTVLNSGLLVNLAWSNPGPPWARTVVLRGPSDFGAVSTTSLTDGVTYTQGGSSSTDTVAYTGTGTSYGDQTSVGRYYYRAFAADGCNNYSAGATTPTPAAPNPTTGVKLTATAVTCGVVSLVAQYSGDGNNNDGVAFTRNGSPVSCTSLTRDARWGTWTCIDTVPSATATYDYAATFADADTVSGINPVTASVTETVCGNGGGTMWLSAHPNGASPTASAPPGQTNVLAGRFQLTAANQSVNVTQIALANTGTATAADIGAVNVYADNGSSPGNWDSGDQLVASAHFSSSANAWLVSGFAQPMGTTNYLVTIAAAYGAVPNDTFILSFSSANVSVGPPGAMVVTTLAITGGTVTLTGAPGGKPPGDATGNSKKPMVLILNPANGATMSVDNSAASKGVRVQVQVYDPSHSSIGTVSLSHDGGVTFPDTLTRNTTYDAVVNPSGTPYYAGVFQADLTTVGAGSFTLQAQATTTVGGLAYSAPIVISVNPPGSGDGNLLVRNNSNQLCIDCHAVQTHSSQATANPRTGQSKYGSWGAECRDCHTPHKTRNAQLISESIVPPAYSAYQSAKTVRFWDRKKGDSGNSNAVSFVTSSTTLTSAGTFGPCQACHTRTSNRSGTPRWQNKGNGDSHYVGASAQACTSCHSHASGFSGRESQGGESCAKCHGGTFNGMQAAGSTAPNAQPHLTKHTLGPSLLGTNDSYTDTNLTWGNPLASPASTAANRSCVNMCHGDHVHNDPVSSPNETHNNNFYLNPSTQASRALTRDTSSGSATWGFATSGSTGSGYLKTDFVSGQYGQGCLACHTNPVDSNRSAISGAAYDSSAHGFTTGGGQTWEYVLHDDNRGGTPSYDSRFQRNCTKCHSGTQTEGQTPSWAGGVQGVHYSDNPSLLGGAINPAGNASTNVCYNCHGGATAGGVVGQAFANGKNIAKLVYHATQSGQSGHPSDSSTAHDTIAEAAATYGNALAGRARHAACLDCHDPHQAKPGAHSGSFAGPAIQNALGAKLVGTLAAWAKPASASNWSVTRIQAGADLEATLCFKCHSAFSWGSGSPPAVPAGSACYNGPYVWGCFPLTIPSTDQAREFNPANAAQGGYHPVLADCSNNYSRIVDLNNLSQTAVRTWSKTSRNRMTCSDCHASGQKGDPAGPHGSAVTFLLRGPNTDWNNSMTVANSTTYNGNTATYKAFCFNCHDPGFASDNTVFHKSPAGRTGSIHVDVPCQGCHAVVQHGGPRPGMLIAPSGVNGNGTIGVPLYSDWDTAAPYGGAVSRGLYMYSYPAAGSTWGSGPCGCNGSTHG